VVTPALTQKPGVWPLILREALTRQDYRIMRPDLLDQYQQEKQRHREELKTIETAMKRAGG